MKCFRKTIAGILFCIMLASISTANIIAGEGLLLEQNSEPDSNVYVLFEEDASQPGTIAPAVLCR